MDVRKSYRFTIEAPNIERARAEAEKTQSTQIEQAGSLQVVETEVVEIMEQD